jgi:transcriptional regulator with XRE-family HTH domain
MLNSRQYIKNIGRVIKAAREKAGLTQVELAEKIDINRVYLSGIENGSRYPGINNLVLIATALKMPLSVIFEQAEKIK